MQDLTEPVASACCASRAEGAAADADRERLGEAVRTKYAAAATAMLEQGPQTGCCGPVELSGEQQAVFGAALYDGRREDDAQALPSAALMASLGCGNPTAVAELQPGEVVLDLGSGGGLDVLLSAQRVAPTGMAYGVDLTEQMVELARRNQAQAGVQNAEFLLGSIEALPLADDSVDVVISNCVINLAGDKSQVLREAARVLRRGGRFAVSDVVADEGMDAATRADMAEWTGCIGGALTEAEYRALLLDAGFADIEVRRSHRVHDQAASAVIRAVRR